MRSYLILLVATIMAIITFIVWGLIYRPDLVLLYLVCGSVFQLFVFVLITSPEASDKTFTGRTWNKFKGHIVSPLM